MMGRTAERSSEIQVHYIRQSSEQKTRVESQRIRALANRNLVPVQKRVDVSMCTFNCIVSREMCMSRWTYEGVVRR